jgi:hypothetical protein
VEGTAMPELVKDDTYLSIMDEMVKEDLEVLDEVMAEDDALFALVANPEQLIGVPYELWTPAIQAQLAQIYGMDNPVLNKFIARKEVEKMYKLEQLAQGV